MKEKKINIKTNPQETDNNSLSDVEARVSLQADFIGTEERLGLVRKKLSELNCKRKFGNDYNDPILYKAQVKSIIVDLLSIYEKMG